MCFQCCNLPKQFMMVHHVTHHIFKNQEPSWVRPPSAPSTPTSPCILPAITHSTIYTVYTSQVNGVTIMIPLQQSFSFPHLATSSRILQCAISIRLSSTTSFSSSHLAQPSHKALFYPSNSVHCLASSHPTLIHHYTKLHSCETNLSNVFTCQSHVYTSSKMRLWLLISSKWLWDGISKCTSLTMWWQNFPQFKQWAHY
jgi:hypothetical protein